MSNPTIVKIEKMQEELRNRAEEAREKGDFISHFFLLGLSSSLETDKLFIASPSLLELYRNILENKEIEINGMKWPIGSLISSTSNEGGSNILCS